MLNLLQRWGWISKPEPQRTKTVSEIVSQFTTMIQELEHAADTAEQEVDNAVNSIALWEKEKALAENELAAANSIKDKVKALVSA